MNVVLISPPMVRACEPLLGIAVLKSYLEAHGLSCACIDANSEAQEWLLSPERLGPRIEMLLESPATGESLRKRATSWRALRRRFERYKRQLRSWEGYTNESRYRTAVTSLNRVYALAGAAHDLEAGSPVQLSMSNYEDGRYSDMDSSSVAKAAHTPEHNLFFAYYRDVLIPRLVEMNPTVVGLSLIFRSQLLCGVVLANMVREALPDVHVVLGGELISAWVGEMDRTHLLGLADSILPYEGELGLTALARELRPSGEEPDLARVPNLLWTDTEGTYHRNPTKKVANLAELPAPDFSWAPWDLYYAPVRTAPMVMARGCYWNRCTFCPEVVNPETLLRLSPSTRLIEDMDTIHERCGVSHFHFIDSAMPPRIVKDIAQHVADHKKPYTWYGFSRLERTFSRPGVAELLARGGCRMLKLGLESGSQRLLDAMDKRQKLEDVSQILRALRDAGVMVHAFLMFGTPFEDAEDAERTRAFVAEHSDCIQFVNCALMNLAHSSPMALEPAKHGIHTVTPFEIEGHDLDLALYSNFEGVGWGRMEARRFLHGVFLKDASIRPMHLRTPAHFDSNHSAFFHSLVFRTQVPPFVGSADPGRGLGPRREP